jgi:transcriptional regulator with XRE-family HTH domain
MRKKSPNPVDAHVGNRIKMRRLMLNISQGDLGKHSRITFQQIQKYERGANRVSASRLQEFAKLLQVPISFFFDGLPSYDAKASKAAPAADLAQQLLSTRDGIDLTKAFILSTIGPCAGPSCLWSNRLQTYRAAKPFAVLPSAAY